MFATACQWAYQYVRPVIVSKRRMDGRVECGCGTFVVLNPDGWVLTAAHIINDAHQAQKDAQEKAEYDREVDAIRSDLSLSKDTRKKRLSRLVANRDWIINQSFWWSQDGVSLDTGHGENLADIALIKLSGFDSSKINKYPVFKDPTTPMLPGTSLCRIGYPFHSIVATFDEQAQRFNLQLPPMPLFPNDGIHTRIRILQDAPTGRTAKFVETSSPGLLGQSGGPIFDANGRIWAIQSHTSHLSLGFSPKVKDGGKEITEHQFMHVGLGTHVEEIIRFTKAHGVDLTLA